MKIGDKTLGFIRAGTGNPTLASIESVASFFRIKAWELLRPASEAVQVASQPVGIDAAKLADHLDLVEAAIALGGKKIPTITKATLLAALYGDEQAEAGSAQAVQALLAIILSSTEEA
ncbi:MAG: hypothetical protein WKG03_21670 [Telluria sp.]